MRSDLDKKLVENFPIIYRDRRGNPKQTLMCFGFAVNDGWFDLLWDLSIDLEKIARNQPPPKKHHSVKKTLWPAVDKVSDKIRRSLPRVHAYPVNKKPKSVHFKLIVRDYIDKFWWDVDRFFAPPEDYRLKAVQVKEKFGELRWYANYHYPEAEKLIDEATEKSRYICETCGEKGRVRNDHGWYITLCENHWLKRQEARKKVN